MSVECLLRKKTLKVHISILFFSSFLPFPYCQCCIEWCLLNFFNIVTERNQRSELLVNFNLKKHFLKILSFLQRTIQISFYYGSCGLLFSSVYILEVLYTNYHWAMTKKL